jgi:formylmethanofuran dehydrogenase subunit E
MCFYTDDPVRDFERWDAEQQAQLDKLPECSECGHKITDEYAYYIHDEWICEDCMDRNYRKEVQPDY